MDAPIQSAASLVMDAVRRTLHRRTIMNARTLMTLLLALLVAAPLLAGDKEKEKKETKKGPKQPAKALSLADRSIKQLAKAELTDDQIAAIKGLSDKYTPRVEEARKKLASILTDEQKQQRREAFAAAKKAGKKPDEVVTALKLTPEQQEAQQAAQKEMKEAFGAYNKEVMALLTDEQRAKIRPSKKGADKKPALKKEKPAQKKEKPAEKKAE